MIVVVIVIAELVSYGLYGENNRSQRDSGWSDGVAIEF